MVARGLRESVSLHTGILGKVPPLLELDRVFTLASVIAHGQPIILD